MPSALATNSALERPAEPSRLVPLAFWACVISIAFSLLTAGFKTPDFFAQHPRDFTDFDAHYMAGKLALAGELPKAYAKATLKPLQNEVAGNDSYMPWAYPPPAHLPMMLLPKLPVGWSYIAFIALGFVAFAAVLTRLAGPYLRYVLLVGGPAMLMNVFAGQNGFYTGALVGLIALSLLRESGRAGYPLGLMVMKPHLGLALGLLCVVQKRWLVLARAFSVALGACAVATAMFGAEVWPAFFNGARESSAYLQKGAFPEFRMMSAYTFLHSLAVPAAVALAAQLLSALAVFAMVVTAAYRRWSSRALIGLAALLTPFVSPYAYDYDMTTAAVGLAVLAPILAQHGRPAELASVMATLFASSAYAHSQYLLSRAELAPASLGFPLAAAGIAGVWLILWRAETASAAPRPCAAEPALC